MSDEQTRNLNQGSSFEDRLFAEFGFIRTQLTGIDGRLAALEMRTEALDVRIGRLETGLTALELRMGALETRMDTVEERLTSLEERVDKRFLQTQPIWETVRGNIASLDDKFSLVIRDLYEIRPDVSAHDKWLKDHERRLNN